MMSAGVRTMPGRRAAGPARQAPAATSAGVRVGERLKGKHAPLAPREAYPPAPRLPSAVHVQRRRWRVGARSSGQLGRDTFGDACCARSSTIANAKDAQRPPQSTPGHLNATSQMRAHAAAAVGSPAARARSPRQRWFEAYDRPAASVHRQASKWVARSRRRANRSHALDGRRDGDRFDAEVTRPRQLGALACLDAERETLDQSITEVCAPTHGVTLGPKTRRNYACGGRLTPRLASARAHRTAAGGAELARCRRKRKRGRAFSRICPRGCRIHPIARARSYVPAGTPTRAPDPRGSTTAEGRVGRSGVTSVG